MNSTPSLAKFFFASSLAIALAAPCALAQTADTAAKQPENCPGQSGPVITKTFYLANTNTNDRLNQDGSKLLATLRNILCPSDKVILEDGQSAIIVQAPADQIALAQQLIADLDRPRKTYRLLYTITELDAGKTVGTQHLTMIAVTGQQTTMKEGEKIPVATGSYANSVPSTSPSSEVQTEFTYLDVGMNIDTTLEELANGVRLQSKVEQSSVGPSNTIAGIQEPVIRQTVLQGSSFLSLDKPVMLGSVDVPNSTHHFDIAVVLEQIK
jgi:type II secretory pathway component GspD/PulD (secretin)